MFKIGEFSKLTQVSVRMLRYYDETGLLKPEKIDDKSGYRYYSAKQIVQLQKIILLRDLDFPVNEINECLKQWDEASITRMLEAKKLQIEDKISVEKNRYKKIEDALVDVCTDKLQTHCNIIIKSVPAFNCLAYRKIIPNYFSEELLWRALGSYVNEHKIPVQSRGITFFYDEEFPEMNVDVEVCVMLDQMRIDDGDFIYRHVSAVEKMACIMIYGPYTNISKGYFAFAQWLDEHNTFKILYPTRQICHIGPADTSDPEEYLTELQIPII